MQITSPLPFVGITYYQFASQAALDNAYSEALSNFNVIENERSCTINGKFIAFVSPCETSYQNPSVNPTVTGRVFEAESETSDTMTWTVNQQLMMAYINGGAGPSGDTFLPWWLDPSNWIVLGD